MHKEANSAELKNAIDSVYSTGYYFNDLVSQNLLIRIVQKDHIKPTFDQIEPLSERELEVLQLICQEFTAHHRSLKNSLSAKERLKDTEIICLAKPEQRTLQDLWFMPLKTNWWMFEKLKEITGGDKERMQVHFNFFLECIEENANHLEKAIESGNLTEIRNVVHTSKPLFDSFEFTEMWEMANNIEQHIDGKMEIKNLDDKLSQLLNSMNRIS